MAMSIGKTPSVDITPYLTPHNFQFLHESNAIENIYEINYKQDKYHVSNKGHFGAFVCAMESAKRHEPLTIKTIELWQKLITEEQD
jgi:hypothetical protein